MYIRDKYRFSGNSHSSRLGNFFISHAERYLLILLSVLDKRIDKRRGVTFADVFISILRFRNRAFGLVLSELGCYVAHATQAPAGTKRISNLLRCKKWTHDVVETHLLEEGVKRAGELRAKGKQVLFLWDDSVLEKPESWFSEGLSPVGSSKAKRLTRIKPGYYRPPAKRVCVPGFEWSSVLMTSLGTIPALVMMRWWTTRGKERTDRQSVFLQMLKTICKTFKDNVLHVLERGFSSEWAVGKFFQYRQLFLIRWIKSHLLQNTRGEPCKVSRFFKPKDVRESRLILDTVRKHVVLGEPPQTHGHCRPRLLPAPNAQKLELNVLDRHQHRVPKNWKKTRKGAGPTVPTAQRISSIPDRSHHPQCRTPAGTITQKYMPKPLSLRHDPMANG